MKEGQSATEDAYLNIYTDTLETIPRSTVVIGQWQKVVTSTFQQICVLLKFFMINNTYH